MNKIGIPKGLLYYIYSPLWINFFNYLDLDVVSSNPTNNKIINNGVRISVDEACMPIKVFYGHVLDIKDNVDYLFIPRIISVKKNEYICPKFMGLPDMIKNSIDNLPQIISPTINLNNKLDLLKIAFQVGFKFSNNPIKIKYAFFKSILDQRNYKRNLEIKDSINTTHGNKICLLGHPYNLYDKNVNMDVINKLDQLGYGVVIPEMLSRSQLNNSFKDLNIKKNLFWTLGKNILSSANYFNTKEDIKGFIYLSSFGCGIDSLVSELVNQLVIKDSDIPFMMINIDEHTGEAGIITRLEAFCDMISF